MSNPRNNRTTSRASHLPSIGPFADPASVSRMFSSGNAEFDYFRTSNGFGSINEGSLITNNQQFFCGSPDKESLTSLRSRRGNNVLAADEGPSPFGCSSCGLTLHSRTALKNHIMQKHKGKRVVKCPHCEKAFTRPSQLRKHISSTHDERTGEFYCDKCTFKNRDVEVYNQHIQLHKVCKYCRNEFSQLSRHEPKCPYRV